MKIELSRPLAIALVSTSLCFPPQLAHAGIVATQEVAGKSQAEQDRAKVQAFLDRANVKERLEALGVASMFAKQRVAALSDAEVHALAERINSAPAGGNLSNSDLIVILLIAILVALVISL
jgi:alpha-D-ribose 1-methylphosphonate 5-triphosphate synthase subunit PhnL